MANAKGGTLYLGADDHGRVCGVPSTATIWADPLWAEGFIRKQTVPPVAVETQDALHGRDA